MNTFYSCRRDGNICDRREKCRRFVECEDEASAPLWKYACEEYELFIEVEEEDESDSTVRKDSIGENDGKKQIKAEGVESSPDVHNETQEEGRDE